MKKLILSMLVVFGMSCYAESQYNIDIGGYGYYGYQIEQEKKISGFGIKGEWQPNKYLGIFLNYEKSTATSDAGDGFVNPNDISMWYNWSDRTYYPIATNFTDASVDVDLNVLYVGVNIYPCAGTWFLDFGVGLPKATGKAKFSDGQSRSASTSIQTPLEIGMGWKFNLNENVQLSLSVDYNILKVKTSIDTHGYYYYSPSNPELTTTDVDIDMSNANGKIGLYFHF